MSHPVLRGTANFSQLYLDGILNLMLKDRCDTERSKVKINEILYFSMKRMPSDFFMINGITGEKFTNKHILNTCVPLAKALLARRSNGKIITIILRNHQQMAYVYYGTLFSGAIPFPLDPNCTVYELEHFLRLVCPSFIFCEQSRADEVKESVKNCSSETPEVIAADDLTLKQFVAGFTDDIDSFRVPEVDFQQPALLLPTSGSTGLPKAAMLTHSGLVAQLPTLWTYHNRFPTPTKTATLFSTAQWMTHTLLMTTCPVYRVTLLMTPKPSIDNFLTMFRQFKPTWTLLSPAYVSLLAASASRGDLASLQNVLTTGARLNLDAMNALKEKLPDDAHLGDGYGMTETHGFITLPDRRTPLMSAGRVLNIFEYKIIDEEGKEVGDDRNGELLLRSKYCILQGYYNNEKAYKECFIADNWLKTGDVFYQNENLLYFVERKKFWFKYLNYHISPEELETVIGSVPGVQECVVCESPSGAAAGIVKQPGFDVTEEDIHLAVKSTLSEYKRLRGGVVFLSALPRTHSGKLNRSGSRDLINRLLFKKE